MDMASPEQIELEERQTEYEALEAEYTASELEYNSLAGALGAFRVRYMRAVGSLYARIDDLRAQVQEEILRQYAHAPAAQEAAHAARARAAKTESEVKESCDEGHAQSSRFIPSDELKKLYRYAVKLIHPDRAESEDDRQLRDRLMAEVNAAYRLGDMNAINKILEQYNEVLSAPVGDSIGAQLVRIIRLISKTKARIAELQRSIAELKASHWCELILTVQRDEAVGLDPLAQLAAKLRDEISVEELRLAALLGDAARTTG